MLIFDDSTSAVDTATESGIRHALAGLGSVTKLIIAQRITSVQSADLIVILDDGRLHAVGTHDELLAKDTIYQEIYYSQMKGGDADGEASSAVSARRTCGTRCAALCDYLGRHKIMLGVVGLLAAVSALAALLGTYMIRPIVNGVLENGSAAYLAGGRGADRGHLHRRRTVYLGLHPAHGPCRAEDFAGHPPRPVRTSADAAAALL